MATPDMTTEDWGEARRSPPDLTLPRILRRPDMQWSSDFSKAPRDGTPILALCQHPTEESGQRSTYATHAETFGRVPDGYHVLVWGGGYEEVDDLGYLLDIIPDWWFRAGSDFEQAAYPVLWTLIPNAVDSKQPAITVKDGAAFLAMLAFCLMLMLWGVLT